MAIVMTMRLLSVALDVEEGGVGTGARLSGGTEGSGTSARAQGPAGPGRAAPRLTRWPPSSEHRGGAIGS